MMKLEEVIKELRENPRKIFRRKVDGLVIELGINDTLFWGSGYRHLSISDEWEEVKEPVTFMEAVESGKKVRVEHPFIIEPYELEQFSNHYRYFTELLEILGTEWDTAAVRSILLEGKFYIED